MDTVAFQPFNPSDQATSALIAHLGDPDVTFRALALQYKTTPEALALLLIRPDIADRLNQTDNVVTWRTRHIAHDFLPGVLTTLARVMEQFKTSTHTDPALQVRAAETARRAATTILRLTTISSPTLRPHTPAAPASSPVSNLRSEISPSSSAPSAPPRETSSSLSSLPPLPPGLDLQTLITIFNEEHAKLEAQLAQAQVQTPEPRAPSHPPSSSLSDLRSEISAPSSSAPSAPPREASFVPTSDFPLPTSDLALATASPHEHWP